MDLNKSRKDLAYGCKREKIITEALDAFLTARHETRRRKNGENFVITQKDVSSAYIIAHQVNCRGIMGADLAKQIPGSIS